MDVAMEVGGQYRLKLDQEIRDEQTGTLKEFIHKGTIIKVKKISVEENQVWLEGYHYPVGYRALRRRVEKV